MANSEYDKRKRPAPALIILLVVLIAYVGFAFVIVLDEIVFKTFWLVNNTPESVGSFIETIYAPVIYLVRLLG